MNSFDLLKALKNLSYIKNERDPYWWPNSGTFEVLVGAILTQQTKWEKVEKSLENLKERDLLDLHELSKIDHREIAPLIKPSGFYNTKAKRVKNLCKNIVNEFGDFDSFKKRVDREWLLTQKGIGEETADSILCYACYREEMVVDSYTNRLLNALGYEFETYGEVAEWLKEGISSNLDFVYELYGKEIPLSQIYARFHGKIVEYSKDYMRGKRVDLKPLERFLDIF